MSKTRKTKQELREILLSAEYRTLEPLQKALHLCLDHGVGTRKARELCKISRKRVRNAVDATKEGREVGINGRPATLSLEEEDQLYQWALSQIDIGVDVTFALFQLKVRFLFNIS